LDEKIGLGSFSDMYRGVWREHVVMIKVLTGMGPRNLFLHGVATWKNLAHPDVLGLLGASLTTDDPLSFLLSPYYADGERRDVSEGPQAGHAHRSAQDDLRGRQGHGVSSRNGILHGDLKVANVLVDDTLCCVMSDFGQSEMCSEVYRLSKQPQPRVCFPSCLSPELANGTLC